MKNKKLRIGILVDDNMIPLWAYRMIETLKIEGVCELVLALRVNAESTMQNSLARNFFKNSTKLFFNFYNFWDKKINKCIPNALETRNLKDLLSEDSTIINLQLSGGDVEKQNLEAIKKHELDILITLNNDHFHPNLPQVARLGAWSFQQFELGDTCTDLTGVREVLEGREETEITLQATFGEHKKSLLLYKTRFSTDPFSINRNKHIFYWIASSIILLKIKELNKLGEEVFLEKIKPLNEAPFFNSKKAPKVPSNKEMLVYAPKLMLLKLLDKFDSTFNFHQWILLFKIGTSDKISTDLTRFQKIIPPRDRFWADPFILKREDKYYIFFEELIYRDNKGYICFIEMDQNGNYTEPVKILERNYHLSYPFLIEEHNELFMIPESKQNNTIELYKCKEFPFKWELEKVLMKNIKAVDTTILFQNNKYWLFCNITNSDIPLAQDELHLFYSDKLNSDNWIRHPKNPIVSDFKRSRPAGKIFKYKNKLYRPAQNGLKHYGYGIAINEIVELTENSYKEELIESILPDWEKDILGTHTINSLSHLTVVDALINRKKKSTFF